MGVGSSRVLYQKGSGFEADGVTPKLVATVRGPADPRLTEANSNTLNILLGTVASYDKVIDNKHTINVLAGFNKETVSGNNFNAFRRYFISTAIDQMFAGGDLEKNNGGGAFERARLNYFGRASYNYKEKYLAEFLWRYDGSCVTPSFGRSVGHVRLRFSQPVWDCLINHSDCETIYDYERTQFHRFWL